MSSRLFNQRRVIDLPDCGIAIPATCAISSFLWPQLVPPCDPTAHVCAPTPNSFKASPSDSTCDLRFTYCACAVSTILGNWNGVDRPKALAYIERCYVSIHLIGLTLKSLDCARSYSNNGHTLMGTETPIFFSFLCVILRCLTPAAISRDLRIGCRETRALMVVLG